MVNCNVFLPVFLILIVVTSAAYMTKGFGKDRQKRSDEKDNIMVVTNRLQSLLKYYLDLYSADNICAKTGNSTIQKIITSGVSGYIKCTSAVKAKTPAWPQNSIGDLVSNCAARFRNENLFKIFAECTSNFISRAGKLFAKSELEVKKTVEEKCYEEVKNNATKLAAVSKNLYNYCISRLSNTPTKATTIVPTTILTKPTVATTATTTVSTHNSSDIIRLALLTYEGLLNRTANIRELVDETFITIQKNLDEVLAIEVPSIGNAITSQSSTARSRLYNAKEVYINDTRVQQCYHTGIDQLNSLENREVTVAQNCFFLNTATIAEQMRNSEQLQTDFNNERLENGKAELKACTSSADLHACTDKVLQDTEAFFMQITDTAATITSDTMTSKETIRQCIYGAIVVVRDGAYAVYTDFRSCAGINA